ncbi:MAG: hypothetical protein TYPL_0730 [Candidatus Tyloplasma litorale]|nr:MAG: hypothetical protein TYPL_0730 [Mycoplasmatales bacterium]
MKENKLDNFANWVIKSKGFFCLAITLLALSSIIISILFFKNIIEINNYYFDEIKDIDDKSISMNIYFRLVLTSLGSIFATLGILLINRNNSNFFYFALTATFLLAVNGFISKLFFDALKWLAVGTILGTQAIIWNVQDIKTKKIKKINLWFIFGLIIFLFIFGLLIGQFGIKKIPESSHFYNKKPILDPLQFLFTITGNIMIIMFILDSRIVYMIGNLLTSIMFLLITIQGDILSFTQLIQGILYFVISFSGYIIMRERLKNERLL